ncbi:MAG: CotH kinase family protein, partial [Dysgonamonadaceae bacterium]|nr:CotH kinase family protein [Dysgonamonadaceae bacterium]
RLKLYNKAKLLGHPAEGKNWTLINNHGDKTLMRNLLAFDISKRLRLPYTPAGRPVNLFLNGEYKGCYQFCDHIDVRKNRVDIKEMKATDISGNNLTGGYLVEIDAYANTEKEWFTSGRGNPVTIKSPDDDVITNEQRAYIKNHFNTLESSIFASNYTHPTAGFRKYMDTETFLKHFIVGELSGNTDTYWSVYMYKQRGDDKFYFGPVWDFDLAFENDQRIYPVNQKSDWIYKYGSAAGNTRNLIDRLLSDTGLQTDLRTLWSNFRDWGIITPEELLKTVDDYADEMYDSQELNFMRWNIRNEFVHQMWGRSTTYAGDVDIVKTYIRDRIAWIDRKINYIPNPDNPNPYSMSTVSNIAVNVWTQDRTIRLNGIREPLVVEIVNITGQAVYKREINKETSFAVSPGIYIVRVSNPRGHSKHFKIITTFAPSFK